MAHIVAGIMAWIYALFSNFFKSGIQEMEWDGEYFECDEEYFDCDGEEIQRDGEEIKSYLKLIEKITDQARQTTSESCPKPPEFYFGQCKYLANELVVAVFVAQLYLVPFIDEKCTSSKDMARFLDACKQLYASAELVQSFIQECCKTSWTQAALGMLNVTAHVSSIGFDLGVCKHVFSNVEGYGNSLSAMEIEDLAEREVRFVKEKVEDDKTTLLEKVEALCQSSESTYTDRVLGKRLLAALKPTLDQEAYCDQGVGSVSQIVVLGTGASGVVHRGIWYKSIHVAMKVIIEDNERARREKLIQARLSHSNVTFLYCYGNEDDDHKKTTLLMDLMERDLFDLIDERMKRDRKYPFPILVAIDIMFQVGMGMQYAHELGLVHRDLKPQNIFSRHVKGTEFVLVKVGDFGSAKIVGRDQIMTTMQGTPRYMAPEMLSFSHHGKDEEEKKRYEDLEKHYSEMMKKYPYKCDVHSFAMLCFVILTGQEPFCEKQKVVDLCGLILRGEHPMLPEWCPEELKVMIERCWSENANDRPSFGDICKKLRYIKYLLLTNDNDDFLVEERIERSKSHWSESSYDDEESLEDKKTRILEAQKLFEEILKQEEDERVKYNHSGPGFYQKMDDLVLGQKFAEGGEADLYYAFAPGKEGREELVVKCFRKGTITLKNFEQRFDTAVLIAFRARSSRRSVFSIIIGGTLLTDPRVEGSLGIVMERKLEDLRSLIDRRMSENGGRKGSENGAKDPPFSEDQVLAMMLGIGEDMKTLHNSSPPIIHRDLKCSNVLYTPHASSPEEFEVVVIDYGNLGVIGTGFFRAPEILSQIKNRTIKQMEWTDKCDVYSYGMTCYELVTGRLPFEDVPSNYYDIVLGGGRPVLPENLHTTIKDLIVSCWELKPSKRPSFDVIVDRLSLLVDSRQLTLHKNPPL